MVAAGSNFAGLVGKEACGIQATLRHSGNGASCFLAGALFVKAALTTLR